MAGFPPEKPIKTIKEEKRAEEEDDPKEENLTGPLDYDLSESILNLRENRDWNPQQAFPDDYRPIVVSGFPASCSAINEVNKNSCSSSSSKIKSGDDNKPKKVMLKGCQVMEFSDHERSQIQKSFELLGFEEEEEETDNSSLGLVQNPNPTCVTQPREEETETPNTFEFLGFEEVEETDNSSLGLVQPRGENLGLGTSLVDRNDQTVNQQIIIPNDGSSARSDRLNPNAPLWIPNQQQPPVVNQIPNQQQQFSIPNRSDQNQPFGTQLNPSAQPWRPQPAVNQMGNVVPQIIPMMITPFVHGNYFNHNISTSNPVLQHFPRPETNQLNQMGMVPHFDPNQAQLMHQPHPFMTPGTNLQQNYMRPETMQQNQMMYNQHFRNMAPQDFPIPETNQTMYYQQRDLRSAPSGLQQFDLPDLTEEVAQRRFERNQQFLDLQLQRQQATRSQGSNAGPSSHQHNLE